MPYIQSYLTDIGLKEILVLDRIIRGEALLEVYETDINVVIGEYCYCVLYMLGRSAL